MYLRGSLYNTPKRQWRVNSKHSKGIWKAKSQDLWTHPRKNTKLFGFIDTSRCMWVWGQNSRVHASIALKFAYNNKHVFFRDDIGTSKYNISPWGLKSLQRNKEGHKYVPVLYIGSMLPPFTHHSLICSCLKEVETCVGHSSVILTLHVGHSRYSYWFMHLMIESFHIIQLCWVPHVGWWGMP